MGKIKFLVHSREGASGLVSRIRGLAVTAVRDLTIEMLLQEAVIALRKDRSSGVGYRWDFKS